MCLLTHVQDSINMSCSPLNCHPFIIVSKFTCNTNNNTDRPMWPESNREMSSIDYLDLHTEYVSTSNMASWIALELSSPETPLRNQDVCHIQIRKAKQCTLHLSCCQDLIAYKWSICQQQWEPHGSHHTYYLLIIYWFGSPSPISVPMEYSRTPQVHDSK